MKRTIRAFGLREQRIPWPIILSLALSASLFGQTAAPGTSTLDLSMDRAVELALRNNLGIQSGQLDTKIKKRKVDTAWNVFIPTVDVGGTISHLNQVQPSTITIPSLGTISMGSSYYWGLSGSVTAALNLNVALFEGIRNLKLDYEAGLVTYDKAKAQLERDIRKSYLQILLIKKNIKLMEDNLANADRRTAMAQVNYKAALVPELSVLQAQVAAENLKPAIADLKNALDSASAALAMNLGLPNGSTLQLDDVTPPDFIALDTTKLISEAAQNKPDLRELRQSIVLLQSNRKLVYENTYTPTLSLAYTMDPTFQKDVWKDSWFDGNNWAQQAGMFRVPLGFRLNGLLPVSKEALGLTDMDDNIQKLNISLSQAIRGTEVDVYTQVLKLEKSRKSMEAQQLNVDLAQRAYKLTEDAYKAGLKDLLEVQNAELELQKAKLEVIKEQFNYMTGLIDLEYAIGVPFGTLSRS